MTGSVVWIERERDPGTVNGLITQKAYHARKRLIGDWRAWAAEAAQGYDPIPGPVTIHVTPLRRTRSRIDPGAPFFAVKGAIDGLVDAGVLADDSTEHVHQLIFERPEVCGRTGLRIVVRPIEQHRTKNQPTPATGQLPVAADPGEPE